MLSFLVSVVYHNEENDDDDDDDDAVIVVHVVNLCLPLTRAVCHFQRVSFVI